MCQQADGDLSRQQATSLVSHQAAVAEKGSRREMSATTNRIHFGSYDDIIPWIMNASNINPSIHQQALDLLSIPAMSTELEKVFQ